MSFLLELDRVHTGLQKGEDAIVRALLCLLRRVNIAQISNCHELDGAAAAASV